MEKIALITGASKGIGKELAYIFASNGYSLLLTARNTVELEQLQTDLEMKYQTKAQILSVDLDQKDSVSRIVNGFSDELKDIDVLVNNAGFGAAQKFADMSLNDVTSMIEVNMVALTQLTHRILPFMLAKKSGKILNVASTAAFLPGPYSAEYYATKAYVLSFSEALYEEYKEQGVSVSALCPGITRTNFFDRSGSKMLTSGFPVMSAQAVAQIGFEGLMNNKRVIIAGFMNKLSVMGMWFTPRAIATKIMAKLQKPKKRD